MVWNKWLRAGTNGRLPTLPKEHIYLFITKDMFFLVFRIISIGAVKPLVKIGYQRKFMSKIILPVAGPMHISFEKNFHILKRRTKFRSMYDVQPLPMNFPANINIPLVSSLLKNMHWYAHPFRRSDISGLFKCWLSVTGS